MLVKYNEELKPIWKNALDLSVNGTFMHERDFIAYHPEDKFIDHSVIIDDKFLFPANEKRDVIYSHQGLSYAGLISPKGSKLTKYLQVFYELLDYYKSGGFSQIAYKQTPQFYCNGYNGSEDYALFLSEAKCYRQDSNVVVYPRIGLKPSERKKRNIKKGFQNKLYTKYSDQDSDFEEYYNKILIPCLKNKHNVSPTHSLEEMIKLKKLFPDSIRLNTVYHQNEIIAGVIWFKNKNVNHSQYIASIEKSTQMGGLDFLFSEFMAFNNGALLSFGVCNEDEGKILNKGLSDWKQEFDAGIVTHKYYKIDLNQDFANLKRNI